MGKRLQWGEHPIKNSRQRRDFFGKAAACPSTTSKPRAVAIPDDRARFFAFPKSPIDDKSIPSASLDE